MLCIAFFSIQLMKGAQYLPEYTQMKLSWYYRAALPGWDSERIIFDERAQIEHCSNYCMVTPVTEDGIQDCNAKKVFLPHFMKGVDQQAFEDFFEKFQKSGEDSCCVNYNNDFGPTIFFLKSADHFSEMQHFFAVHKTLSAYVIDSREVDKINEWLCARNIWNSRRWKICEICGAQFSCTLTLAIHFDGLHNTSKFSESVEDNFQ